MADIENSKDLTSVLWSGADVLRSKMDANEYKNYLLGIVFYKYLSDSFLIKVYDLLYDEKPETLRVALDAYREALEDESAEELKEQLEEECHYVIEPELTYTCFADAARNNSLNDALVFLQNGALIDLKGDLGYTPLHYACMFGNIEMVKLLLDNGSDKNIQNEFGENAVRIAINSSSENKEKIVKLLIKNQMSDK